MTVITTEMGYLDDPYLIQQYALAGANGNLGMAVEFIIEDKTSSYGMQADLTIVDLLSSMGFQTEFNILDSEFPYGFQTTLTITDDKSLGTQALFVLEDKLNSMGMQAELFILEKVEEYANQAVLTILSDEPIGNQALFDLKNKFKPVGSQIEFIILTEKARGMEVRIDEYPSLLCGPGYLESAYLQDYYLNERICHIPGMQTEFTIESKPQVAQQANFSIADYMNSKGMQAIFEIDSVSPYGMEFDSVNQGSYGMQFLSTIYNTTNLRILCEFPSRGLNNSNWTANSTAAGDFSVQNLDTDIVEQVWRSQTGTITGIRLQTDTGIPQGVFLDTFAMLNHNLTRSANVSLIGSNDPTFVSIGVIIPLDVRTTNIYYIAPSLPINGYRYWRIDIDDPTNTDNFIQIGTVLFGASNIFQGECFVDEVDFELKDFTDTVRTEGFTNVSNSRALKRKVKLEFRFLNFQKNNFRIMRNLFETYRTTHKCLWIPTPSATDPTITARFAAYAKLTVIPSERHKYLGGEADYVSFTLEVDESL